MKCLELLPKNGMVVGLQEGHLGSIYEICANNYLLGFRSTPYEQNK